MKAKAGSGSNYETKTRGFIRKTVSAAATASVKGYKRKVNVTSSTGAEGPKGSSPRGQAAKKGKGGTYGPAPGKGRPAKKGKK